MKKTKPGVMIYFSILDAFSCLTYEEKGILFEAILRFAKDGKEPKKEKLGPLLPIWRLLKPHLVADNERYYEVTTRRQYAAYVRWSKKKGQEVLDYDDWVASGGAEKEHTYLDAEDALG